MHGSWRVAWASRTLPEACRALLGLLPDRGADATVLRDYYKESAKLYRHMVEVDPEHKHEARALAWVDTQRAESYAKLAASESQG
ncbi:AMED_5909 family protein [Sciscionella sediminilitoris]|uniref:AMED_5909 family protein n=1 Tax=Sciscionella sediminilitoris TaxID=1445613 RepID=UPI0012E2C8C3|nr:AMED_5909 family protein [Sciscionella sp. SE31]